MSLASWMREFYSIDASAPTTERGAVEHCIRKWEGLRPENLARHQMQAVRPLGLECNEDAYDIVEIGSEHLIHEELNCFSPASARQMRVFRVSSDTCALCALHSNRCTECVLYKARGDLDCYSNKSDEEKDTPFEIWGAEQDPEPMIFWLVKARHDLKDKS